MNEINIVMLIFSVAGTVILLLIGLIGFFLKTFVKAIDDLKFTVNDLKLVVELQKQELKSFNKLCEIKHKSIDVRLDELEHSK
jgi:hypothetical protein